MDLAVDSTQLLVEKLLSIADDLADTVLDLVADTADLVSTLGDNLGVVGRTTTVPGKQLWCILVYGQSNCSTGRLTLGVSEGMSERAPWVATVIKASLSFLGVISSTA